MPFGSLITIKRDGKESLSFPFIEEKYIFGRSKECDIRVNLDSIAEKHCTITFEESNAVLTNISGFPMLINGSLKEIKNERFLLSDKDIFSIGGRSFKFSTKEKQVTKVEIIGRLVTPKKEVSFLKKDVTKEDFLKKFSSPLVPEGNTQRINMSAIEEETKESVSVEKVDREIIFEINNTSECSQRRSSLYITEKGFVLKEEESTTEYLDNQKSFLNKNTKDKPFVLRRSERIKKLLERKKNALIGTNN